MTEVYREILLRGRADWAEVVSTVRAAAPAMARAGRPLRVILADEDQDRLEEQIRYYWSAVIGPIAEQVWADGRRYSPKAWHLHMKDKFLTARELRLPDGSIKFVQPSIARGEITVGQMAEYTTRVTAYAAADLGVQFD
ncbi:recombinase [Cupriavidus taiwanensis]|uniref:recombinase n=1 Tax=Cupriavidus taiwanensis TaxID=164546 RepID=UPI001571C67C|nr:recombinase [Cupriavidus taiwanensis]NSX14975.1 recombinase [Cupriavidus taiwanensis]